jgi:predicted HAD superfamily phosphohydrolase YqeG
MEKYFKELDITGWVGKTVILDIDGTITTDGNSCFDYLILEKIKEISLNNSVFLFSNKHLPIRDSEIADSMHIPLLKSHFKKPSRKVINELPEDQKKNLLVIGDKIIIDGLFAKNIGAEFIKVKRLTNRNDSFNTKLTYLLDNTVGYFIN